MSCPEESPVALVGADRADVTLLAGKYDRADPSSATSLLQVRHLLARFAISHPLAAVVAEHAFGRSA